MKIELEIEDQIIIDLMITALEGGSNYWYYLPDTDMVKKYSNFALSENIAKSVLDGAIIPVYDIEDDHEFLGNITIENIKRGIKKFILDGYNINVFDAGDADVFFQYVVMNDLIFG